MKNANNSALNNLLNSVGNSAAEITRNLSLFGDGNMGKGIQNLFSSENCLKTEISDGAITIDNSPVNTAEFIEPQTKNTV